MKGNYFIQIVLILFLIPLFSFGQTIRYASVNGSGAQNGTSESNAWSYSQAFAQATGHMTVYCKKGLKIGSGLVVGNSGLSVTQSLKFIGYNTIPGDISTVDGQYSTFSIGDSVDSNIMPLIRENRSSNHEGDGIGLQIPPGKNFVHIENFQVQYYKTGFLLNGVNNTLKNCIADEQGDFNPLHTYPDNTSNAFLNNVGNGIVTYKDNARIINCFVLNSGAQGYTFVNSNNIYAEGNTMFSDSNVNPVDYHFLIAGGTKNGTFKKTYVRRTPGQVHQGHGIVFKSLPDITGNLVEDFLIENTYLEVQWSKTYGNTFRNGTITLEGSPNNVTLAGIRLANGSYNNHFENITLNNCSIKFADWIDGLSGDVADSGDDNTFDRITVNGGYAAIAFSHMNPPLNLNSSADNNIFTNCTFNGTLYLYQVDRPNSGTQLINCQITNIPNIYAPKYSGHTTTFPPSVSYDHCNFFGNGFSVPTGTSITTHNPLYVDSSSGNYSLAINSPSKGIGKATAFLSAGNDIGAVQSSGGPSCTDGIQNGNETGIDCGGPDCPPCVSTNICNGPSPSEGIVPVQILVSDHQTAHGPCNLMDNSLDPESRWSSLGDGQWAQFDLGAPTQFDQLQIAFYLGTTQNSFFDIQVSDDAVNWTDVLTSQQSSGNTLQLQDFDFPLQNARYVRYLGHGDSKNSNWNSVTEVRIKKVGVNVTGIEVTPENLTLNVGETSNLALDVTPNNATNQTVNWSSSDANIATVDSNGVVTAVAPGNTIVMATSQDGNFTDTSNVAVTDNICNGPSPSEGIVPVQILVSDHQTAHGPCNLMDNSLDPESRWSSLGDGQWAQFDLGAPTEFDQLQIAFYLGTTQNSFFDIQMSDDAVNWTDVLTSQQSSGNTLQLQDFDFPLQNARYVRYLGHGDSKNSNWNSVTEIRIKKVGVDCPDNLPNENTAIVLPAGTTFGWDGASTIIGVSDNTNGSDCALKLQKDTTGEPWGRYQIIVDLATNNISPGDEVSFSLDANGDNGSPRFLVAFDSTSGPFPINYGYPTGVGWSSYADVVTIPAGATMLRLWFYPNSGNSATGYSLFDNLNVEKIVPIVCPDDLPNENTAIVLPAGTTFGWDGASTIIGVSDNTNGSDCALKLQKDTTGEPWGRYQIIVDLATNNISPGDEVSFSLDANGDNGSPRFLVAFDSTSGPFPINYGYPTGIGWSSYADVVTIPAGATMLRLWFYPNSGNSATGYSLFDNLNVEKTASSTLKTRLGLDENSTSVEKKSLKIFPNPVKEILQIILPNGHQYSRYSIHDLNGILVEKETIGRNVNSLVVPVDNLESGVYLFAISGEIEEPRYFKFIKE